LAAFGGITLLVAAFYVRDLFAFGFMLTTGIAMLLASRFISLEISDMILRTIGVSSMIYAPLDIFDDTIRRAHLRSDARILAEQVGGSTLFWGGLWLVISLGVIVLILRYGLPQNSNIHQRRR
jgi:hypothetical protein